MFDTPDNNATDSQESTSPYFQPAQTMGIDPPALGVPGNTFHPAALRKPSLLQKSIKTMEANVLKVVSVHEDGSSPVLLFTTRTEQGYIETTLPCSPYVYRRLKSSNPLPGLRDGLIKASQYQFILYTQELDGKMEDGSLHPVTCLTGVTSYPDPNLMAADMSVYLKKPVAENALILNLYSYGDFDVSAFPLRHMGIRAMDVPNVLRYIDKSTIFYNGSTLSLGKYGTAYTQSVMGNEVVLTIDTRRKN